MSNIAVNRLMDPSLLTNALATYYTSPANQYTLVKKCNGVNNDTVARKVTVELIKSGGAAGNASMVWNQRVIAPGQSYEVFELENKVLNPGDFIQAKDDAGGVTSFGLDGLVVAQ